MFTWFNSLPVGTQWVLLSPISNIVVWTLVGYWTYNYFKQLVGSKTAKAESGHCTSEDSPDLLPRQSEPLPTHNPSE